MSSRIFEITKAATFDAAHHLPANPGGGPYTRVHGHSFKVEATVRGEEQGAKRKSEEPHTQSPTHLQRSQMQQLAQRRRDVADGL